jgi:DNA-binding transcriptional ArsR family regulator
MVILAEIHMEDNERVAIYRLHAEFCKTLADASRLLIMHELAENEVSVGDLVRRLGLNQSSVSKHLGVMKEHGLALSRREGATVYYRLSDPRISQAINLLCSVQADQIDRQRNLARAA